ncbi:MAG: amidase family protein, partial [Clostridiales bacterium]
MTAEFTAAFHQFDVLLTPTTRQIAFPLAAAPADPVEMYLNDLLLAPVNLAGLCSISIPYGQVDGMINGIQLIGPKMGEALLFQIGRFLENN